MDSRPICRSKSLQVGGKDKAREFLRRRERDPRFDRRPSDCLLCDYVKFNVCGEYVQRHGVCTTTSTNSHRYLFPSRQLRGSLLLKIDLAAHKAQFICSSVPWQAIRLESCQCQPQAEPTTFLYPTLDRYTICLPLQKYAYTSIISSIRVRNYNPTNRFRRVATRYRHPCDIYHSFPGSPL